MTFSDLALVKVRLGSIAHIRIRQERFNEAGAIITADLPEAEAPQIIRMIMDITSGRATVRGSDF